MASKVQESRKKQNANPAVMRPKNAKSAGKCRKSAALQSTNTMAYKRFLHFCTIKCNLFLKTIFWKHKPRQKMQSNETPETKTACELHA
jgi:hypothetical protein